MIQMYAAWKNVDGGMKTQKVELAFALASTANRG